MTTADQAGVADLRDPTTLKPFDQWAIVTAAAGRHSMLVVGPTGSGKTRLVQALITLRAYPEAEATQGVRVWYPQSGAIHLADPVVVIESLTEHDPAILSAVFGRRAWQERSNSPLILATALLCACGGYGAQFWGVCHCASDERRRAKQRLARYADQFDLVLAGEDRVAEHAEDRWRDFDMAETLAAYAGQPAPTLPETTILYTRKHYRDKTSQRRFASLLAVATTIARVRGLSAVLPEHVDTAWSYVWPIQPEL